MKPKILLIGQARVGKDTFAEMMGKFHGYTFQSSSEIACKICIFDQLKETYGYKNINECFNDRINHRKEWHDIITEYNKEDRSRLAKDIMKDNDIYVGMRNNDELLTCMDEGIFDIVIGVVSSRVPPEDESSCNIDIIKHSDIIVVNNGGVEDLERVAKNINIQELIKKKKHKNRVMLFTTPGCGPCNMMKPNIKRAKQDRKYKHILFEEINCGPLTGSLVKYGVTSFPTTIILKDNKEVFRTIGPLTYDGIEDMLEKYS